MTTSIVRAEDPGSERMPTSSGYRSSPFAEMTSAAAVGSPARPNPRTNSRSIGPIVRPPRSRCSAGENFVPTAVSTSRTMALDVANRNRTTTTASAACSAGAATRRENSSRAIAATGQAVGRLGPQRRRPGDRDDGGAP